jgi:hypothetical protein
MNRGALQFQTHADRSRADEHGDAPAASSNDIVRAGEFMRSRSWAWAHASESYDWMDSHSPSLAAGLSH